MSPSPFGPTQRARSSPHRRMAAAVAAARLRISSRCLAESGAADTATDPDLGVSRSALGCGAALSIAGGNGSATVSSGRSSPLPPQPATTAQSATDAIQRCVARIHGRYAARDGHPVVCAV